MKKVCKILIVIIVVFITIVPTSLVYATNDNDKDEVMEQYMNLRKEYLDLKQQWSDEKIILEKKKDDVDSTIEKIICYVAAISAALSVLVVAGGIVSVVAVKKCIKEKVEKQLENFFEKEDNVEKMKKLISNYDHEEKIMKEKSIIVISRDGCEQDSVENILGNFKKKKFITYEENLGLDKYDLILFNNINNENNLSNSEIINIIEKNKNKVFLYFGPTRKLNQGEKSLSDVTKNINYANTEITLYSNLMVTLKFQDDILPRNK